MPNSPAVPQIDDLKKDLSKLGGRLEAIESGLKTGSHVFQASLAGLVVLALLFVASRVSDAERHLSDRIKETKTEVRMLQIHVQDLGAALVAEGYIKPGDLTGKGPVGNRIDKGD